MKSKHIKLISYLMTLVAILLVGLLLTILATCEASAQTKERNLGAFVHVASETFYKKNLSASIGIRYKEFRLGYYHQSASRETGTFVRRGLIAEAGIINVDEIVYLSLGARVMTTSDKYVQVAPHATLAFRLNKHVEIPIVLSTYSSWLTGSIGLRMLL